MMSFFWSCVYYCSFVFVLNWGFYEVGCVDNVSCFISNNSRKLNESFLVSLIVIVFCNAF